MLDGLLAFYILRVPKGICHIRVISLYCVLRVLVFSLATWPQAL